MPFGASSLTVDDTSKLVEKSSASYFSRLTRDASAVELADGSSTFISRLVADIASTEQNIKSSSYFSRIDTVNTPDFTVTSSGVEVLFGNSGFEITASSTVYVGSTVDTVEASARYPVPEMTLQELYIACSTAPGSGETIAGTVMKNGVATALTATISASGTSASLTGQSISVSAGDTISVRFVMSSGAATTYVSYGIKPA